MAEFAYEPGPEVQLAAGESAKEISGRSPWRIAGRRLVRNRLAMASLGLFLLIVVVSLLAPFYANHVAKTDPFSSNLTGTTNVNGKEVEVVQETQGGLGLGVIPIGPTWQSNYFIGADNQGRDVMARVLYGGRSSLQIGVASAVICTLLALALALLAGFFRGWTDSVLSRIMDLIWAFPVYLLAISLATVLLTKPGGLQMGPGDDRPVEPLGPDLDHRDRLHPLRLSPATRPGAFGAREGVRRGLDLAGRLEPAPDVRRDPPQRDLDRDRAPAADDRDHDPDRGCALVPRDRRAGAAGELGHDHRRRPEPALHAPAGRDRARGSSSCSPSSR